MKAVILAAGQGTRLRPLTDHMPKCMVEAGGKAIVDHQIELFRSFGFDRIVIVRGYRADALERQGINFYDNAAFDRTNMVHSLFCAEPELEGDVVISYGDIIYRPEVLRALVDCPDPLALTVDLDWRKLWEARMDDPLGDAESLVLDERGYIRELGRKTDTYDRIQAQYMGLILVRAAAWPRLIRFYRGMDRSSRYDGKDFDNMYMTTFLQQLIDNGLPIRAVPVRGGWIEVDAPEDLPLYDRFVATPS